MTRYNYAYEAVNCGGDEIDEPPGTPDDGSALWTDYAGGGRDQLLSLQKLVFKGEELAEAKVETFEYSLEHPHMRSRTMNTWLFDDEADKWWLRLVEHTDYRYPVDDEAAAIHVPLDRLQSTIYWYKVYDNDEDNVCEPKEPLVEIDSGAVGEMYAYDDLLGRRTATWSCQIGGTTEIDWGPEGPCKARSRHFDYYGLSQRVAMVRTSPFFYAGCLGPEERPGPAETATSEGSTAGGCSPYENNGDGFEESYTYSPVGPVVRTYEEGDADSETFTNNYVAADLWGGTTAMLLYGGEEEDRVLITQHFDAFGVRAANGEWSESQSLSRYRWRSQEGSETDDLTTAPYEAVTLTTPYLVYMQTRHYDPALGRFIMADSIPMGAFSPQGLNRYAYCTNDPVNSSDPTGMILPILYAALMAIAFAAGFNLGLALAPPNLPATTLGGATQAVVEGAASCTLWYPVNAYVGPTILAGIAEFVGASTLAALAAAGGAIFGLFMLGVAMGYMFGAMVSTELSRIPRLINERHDVTDPAGGDEAEPLTLVAGRRC